MKISKISLLLFVLLFFLYSCSEDKPNSSNVTIRFKFKDPKRDSALLQKNRKRTGKLGSKKVISSVANLVFMVAVPNFLH